MNEKEWVLLQGTALFCGVEREKLSELLDKAHSYRVSFVSGEEIPLFPHGKGRIGILLEGAVSVYADEEKRVLLNRLEAGSLFGVSSLYGEEAAGTLLLGKGKGKILFCDTLSLEPFWENPILRKNLISFLTGRIRFLNQKINQLSASQAEEKVYRSLLQQKKEDGTISIPRSLAEWARSLNLGRASLYRALAKLEKSGVLRREGKVIFIRDPQDYDSL